MVIIKCDELHKYIDLSSIPMNKGHFNWRRSIGLKLYFEYDTIKDFIEIIDYKDSYITIKYKNEIDTLYISSFKNVSLGKVLNKRTNEFKIEISTTFKDDKRNLTIIDREYRYKKDKKYKWYKYICNECGWSEGWIEESHLLNGRGCGCCANKVVVPGINDIATTDPWMIPYLVNSEDAFKYTSKSHKYIAMKCIDCNESKRHQISKLNRCHNIGCNCGDGFSYPEKFIYNIFNQIKLDFIYQYNKTNASWCKSYRYDFYMHNKIVEVHGEQHYRERDSWGKGDQKKIDINKRILALNNNIDDYIEINCSTSNKEYIKQSILHSRLVNYYDFSNVDWEVADEYATKNIIKEICQYYEHNKDTMLMKEIATYFNILPLTLTSYLKQGDKFGWCEYVNGNKTRASKYKHSNKPRKVKVIETGDIFDSLMECERMSLELYGVKFNHSNISAACIRNIAHKGYHFEYVTD